MDHNQEEWKSGGADAFHHQGDEGRSGDGPDGVGEDQLACGRNHLGGSQPVEHHGTAEWVGTANHTSQQHRQHQNLS